MRLVKGHGTQNDFLVLPDLDGALDLPPELVRALCDRHAGIGADGVLRVVRSDNHPEAKEFAADAEFFMDYRNADGSVAEMCGNGIRVFLQYLIAAGLVEQDAAVATRGGIRRARAYGDGNVTVDMGLPRVLADRPIATAALIPPQAGRPAEGAAVSSAGTAISSAGTAISSAGTAISSAGTAISSAGTAILLPNPHVVVVLGAERSATDGLAELAALDLSRPPVVQPALPGGQNVEFVVRLGPRHLTMRVHERGVGETRSCGTGICAAAVALAHAADAQADGSTWRVDVPGGSCQVVWRTDGQIELTGPAVLVAEVDVDAQQLLGR